MSAFTSQNAMVDGTGERKRDDRQSLDARHVLDDADRSEALARGVRG